MRFRVGDWVLGASCLRCRRQVPVFNDPGRGAGALEPPIVGGFSFRCVFCGAHNETSARDLTRSQVGAGALESAA